MPELIHTFSGSIAANGQVYIATAHGRRRDDSMWEGWLEFTSPEEILRTDRETLQSTRDALAYWATGVEPVYLEGALARARLTAIPGVTKESGASTVW